MNIKLETIESYFKTFPQLSMLLRLNSASTGRVVLFNFIRRDISEPDNVNDFPEEDEEVEVRHYAIRATPVGVNRKVRRIIQAKIANLSKLLDDISDFIIGTISSGFPAAATGNSGVMSDSEVEDETSHVVLPKYSAKWKCKVPEECPETSRAWPTPTPQIDQG